jgi:hypothetical protein
MIVALPVIITAVGTLFVLISVGVLEWHLYTTRRSDVVGPGANPTAADRILTGAGDIVGGTGDAFGGWAPFAIIGVAVFALLSGRR